MHPHSLLNCYVLFSRRHKSASPSRKSWSSGHVPHELRLGGNLVAASRSRSVGNHLKGKNRIYVYFGYWYALV